MVKDKVSGASSSGSVFTDRTGHLWANRRWGHLVDDLGGDMPIGSCRGFCSVPGPLQSVQRAEFWCHSCSSSSADVVHLGVDNLGVVRHVGRMLDGNVGSRPAELVEDGDLMLLIGRMLQLRGLDTVRITKVKGHADEGMVRDDEVCEQDRVGNNAADEAADFGRRRVDFPVVDARRNFGVVCGRWCSVILTLHRFLIGSSGGVVNHVDGDDTATDPLVWSAGALPKRRRLVHAVRDHAFLPGPAGIRAAEWIALPAAPVTADDVGTWPNSFGMLVKRVAFLGSLHWPAAGADLGVGSVSIVEILIMCELWAGERLVLEKAVHRCRRPGRPISVSAVPFGSDTDIGALFRH